MSHQSKQLFRQICVRQEYHSNGTSRKAYFSFFFIVLSRASAHGRSQLKHQKLGFGCYTEEVLEWFDYPRASTHFGWKVSCLGLPNRPASSLHHASSRRSCIVLESGPTCTLIANLPKCLSLLLREFLTAGVEHCEQDYGRVLALSPAGTRVDGYVCNLDAGCHGT